MRRAPLGEQLAGTGILTPPEGYVPPKSAEELHARIGQGETYFCDSDLSGQIFDSVSLGGVYLFQSKFDGAIFRGCTFDQTKLIGSTFIDAKFSNTTFEHCIMMGSDLFRSILRDTRLLFCDARGAFFGETEFFRCLLFGNWLGEATFFATRFLDTPIAINDLSETKHPEQYSIVDVATLHKSAAILLAAATAEYGSDEMNLHARKSLEDVDSIQRFFRACGVPPEAIGLFRRWLLAPEYASVFISYSTQDEAFAKELDRELRKRGIDVWFAPHSIRGGRTILEQVTAAISRQERVILILSESSMQSGWVETEIRHAILSKNSARRLFPIRLVPFDVLKQWKLFDSDSGRDLARYVRDFYVPDFSGWRNEDAFLTAVEHLCRDLRSDTAPAGSPA